MITSDHVLRQMRLSVVRDKPSISLFWVQATEDAFDHSPGFVRNANGNGDHASLFRRIVVSSCEWCVACIDHCVQRDAESVAQLANSIGLVDALLGHID